MALLAGIDGGGSKTDCWLADAQGKVLGRGRGGASSLTHVSGAEAARQIEAALREAFAGARLEYRPEEVAAACGGFAGAGHQPAHGEYEELLGRQFPRARCRIETDVRIGFEGGLAGHPGVIVIAGTGSIAYGRNGGGGEARAGGYGPELSDEGGGFVLGREAVRRVLEAYDGRRPPTRLRDSILRHWRLEDEARLLDYLLSARQTAARQTPIRYAELLPALQAAAADGDAAARELLEQAGAQLAALAVAVAQRLELTLPEIAYAGSVLNHSEAVRESWSREMRRQLPGARLLAAAAPPPAGALRLAASMLTVNGAEISELS